MAKIREKKVKFKVTALNTLLNMERAKSVHYTYQRDRFSVAL